MYLNTITEVATEPVTLAEVKRHLNIYDDGYDDTQEVLISARAQSVSVVTGSSIDIQGAETTVYVNVSGVGVGGTLSAVIEESDNDSDFTTYYTFSDITSASNNSKLYEGGKRYIRLKGTVTVDTVTYSADATVLAGDPISDTFLSNIITRAREEAEEITRLAFAPQTLELGLDEFPTEDFIRLPRGPLTSVTSVKTKDSAGSETTLTASTQYLVDTDQVPGRVVLPYNVSWPSNADYPMNPIKIRYVAGYTTLPQKLKNILLLHIGILFKHRDNPIPAKERQELFSMYKFYRVSWFGGEFV